MTKNITQLVQMACMLEACAPKPGNVNRAYDFSDSSLEDYLLSAIAIGPAFDRAAELTVGEIVHRAVLATRRLVRSNTNLGMVLLLAPLAQACAGASDLDHARVNLKTVLAGLTVNDAELSYEAIRLAHPGGMGQVARGDISERPAITLMEAMTLAQERDTIAREYATGYSITLGMSLPCLQQALSGMSDFPQAIVHTFLTILSQVPDTLIARKMGCETAVWVSRDAVKVLGKGSVYTEEGRGALAEFDRSLRSENHELNPGTTADLTTAAIFLALFERSSAR